jgi:transcriptional regulator with XRE-family HTH domain
VVGRPLKPINPNASAACAFGADVRARRTQRRWTQRMLADQIGYSPQHVSDVELGQTAVSEHFAAAVDCVLEADGSLRAQLEAVVLERARGRQQRAHDRDQRGHSLGSADDVRRRAFIRLGLAVVLLGPEAAARATSEDWERIAYEWSRELFVAEDRQALLPGLAADMRRLNDSARPQHAVLAQLSVFVAMIATSAGNMTLARRWWQRAQHTAQLAADPQLIAFVGGQRAVHAHMVGAPQPDGALAATSNPCAGRMHALTAHAKALSVLGRKREATSALHDAEVEFERLPRDITREKLSVAGWAEERLHHAQSFMAAFGGIGDGEAARAAALRLYRPPAWRGPTQIRLHQAAIEVDADYAVATLCALSAPQRADRSVRENALRVLAVCQREAVGGAIELRDALR